MKTRRRHYLAIAVLLAGGLGAFGSWWWWAREPVLHFVEFTEVARKRCAVFTLENTTGDVYFVRGGGGSPFAETFTKVQRETGWDTDPTATPRESKPQDENLSFIITRATLPLPMRPGDSARITIPVPQDDDAAGRIFKSGIRIYREPSNLFAAIAKAAPRLIPRSFTQRREVTVWSPPLKP